MLRTTSLALVLTWTSPAAADMLPEPTRPAHWHEQPEPMPDPPPEKEPLLLVFVALVGFAALFGQRTPRCHEAAG